MLILFVFFPSSIAGSWGPCAQRLSSAVCLWEVEGSADVDGGPGFPGSHGDGGHGDCATAARVYPGHVRMRQQQMVKTSPETRDANLLMIPQRKELPYFLNTHFLLLPQTHLFQSLRRGREEIYLDWKKRLFKKELNVVMWSFCNGKRVWNRHLKGPSSVYTECSY